MTNLGQRAAAPFAKIGRAARAELHAVARRSPVRPRTVLYESFAGNEALCNPEAIFRELMASPDQADLEHIWVLDNLRRKRSIQREFAGDSRVRFVQYRSNAYFRALATSEYLINNATFPPEFSKRPGQIYLNTWHGTPLKLMGYDMPRGAFESANTLRNFLAADFLLSQNSFMTTQMYETAYKLRGIYRGTIIEEGYPRVDRQSLSAEEVADARGRLEASGITLHGRKIVLYAPTWKGRSFSSPENDAQALVDSVAELQRELGDDEYVVLLKTHQAVHRYASAKPEYRKILVPNDLPTNIMLGLSDLLITDYSSIFFDFLATGRPIVFYTPDETSYSEARGTYFALDQLPGPICSTIHEVATAIGTRGEGFRDRVAEWAERFSASDDGSVSSRIVDAVFRGAKDGLRSVSIAEDGRESLLMHLGGMRSNGITTSALNLLASIDHSRVNVTVIFGRPRGPQERANQARVDSNVRQLMRAGGMSGSKISHARRRLGEFRGATHVHQESTSQAQLWDQEWMRCFGESRFDLVADFSGYSAFWATLLLHAPKAIRSIWLHNDMAAEEHRMIRGRKRMSRSLRAVFSLYRDFDSLISVSPSLNEVNRRSLAELYSVDATKFVAARNLVDESNARQGMLQPVTKLVEFGVDPETGAPMIPDWASEMAAKDGTIWFCSVGRFSQEKNQARMLAAFDAVSHEHPNVRLVLVGYGPLRDELRRDIHHRGLDHQVHLVGPFSNPFAIMAAADCFVLSSNYEGQPMVILEAATVGLPIISVDFDSIRDALPTDVIHVVAQDDDALADGMRAFLAGTVKPASLDAAKYNSTAIEEFLRGIGSSVAAVPVARA